MLFFRFTGIVIVSVATSNDTSTLFSSDNLITGALWSVLGSFCYAVYLVFFKISKRFTDIIQNQSLIFKIS